MFCRSLSDVLLTITPFPPRLCPSFCSAGNWVCLAHLPPAGRTVASASCRWSKLTGRACPESPAEGMPVPRCTAEIGFVFPVLFAGPLSHNSFPANHLPFVLPRPKLGLFGAEAQGPGAEGAGVRSLTPISETRSDLTHRPVDFRALARLAWIRASAVMIFRLLSNHESYFVNHKPEDRLSLYLGAVLHERCRNSVRARGPKIA